MKKLAAIVLGLAFGLCAFSVQAASTVVLTDVPSRALCTTNADCSDGTYCNGQEVCNVGTGACSDGPDPVCSGGTPYCDEPNDKCSECIADANCSDDGVYCNGAEFCNVDAGECESQGDPCAQYACGATAAPCDVVPGPICDEDNDRCVECLIDATCDDGLFCNGAETCDTGSGTCNGSPGSPCLDYCNETSNECVECLSDDNCTAGVCENNFCIECVDNADCPEDGDPCNGEEICSSGQCQSSGNPCPPGDICVPNNPNAIPPAATLPPPYICAECVSDDNCTDDLFCNGDEYCSNGTCYSNGDPCMEKGATAPAAYGPVCDEANDACVECITDDNCTDPGEPYCDVNNTCVECLSDPDCDNGTFCDGAEQCDNGTCYPGEPPCQQGEMALCDEDNNTCVECFDNGDCEGDNGTPLCDGVMCVECLVDADCDNSESCNDEGSCVQASCDLIIKPAQVRINNKYRPVERRFRITGGEGFDPYAELDFGLMKIRRARVTKKGVLKVLVTIPAGAIPNKGPYEIRVGNCVGTILLK